MTNQPRAPLHPIMKVGFVLTAAAFIGAIWLYEFRLVVTGLVIAALAAIITPNQERP